MDRNGGNRRPLTDTPSLEDSPASSPTGDRIAFLSRSTVDDPMASLNLLTLDGKVKTKVTDVPAQGPLAWSPDGKQLAFAAPKGDGWDIYIIDVNGSNGHFLTQETTPYNTSPAWSPDGQYIAFRYADDSGSGLAVLPITGGSTTHITHEQAPGTDFDPCWTAGD
jgi:TolB protein